MSIFQFKEFSVKQADSAMKVGTDAMVLGALMNAPNAKKALDVGCGTGVLSLMLAQKNSQVQIDAIDIDNLSVEECRINFENSKWGERLNAFKGDFLDFKSSQKYDFIFSNPPFFETSNLNKSERKALARHSNSLPANEFTEVVCDVLNDSGAFWIIVPFKYADKWIDIAKANGLSLSYKVQVFGKEEGEPMRSVLRFGRISDLLKESSLTIRELDGSYTDEYITLTRNFHGVDLNNSH